jgi:predicted metal-dependent enzyme (double-stranded beta helix superfamily)
LWASLLLTSAALAQTPVPAEVPSFVQIRPDQMVWKTVENGVKTTVLFGDPSKPGFYVQRNIFPPGVMSTPHDHDHDRWVTVIRGVWNSGTDADWRLQATKALPAGSVMFHPAGAVHFDGSASEEVEVQIMGFGPVKTTYVHPDLGHYGRPAP